MRSDVMEFFGLTRTFSHIGYFETEHQTDLVKELKIAIRRGELVAISGVVGCGKTTLLQRLQTELKQEKDILVSRSLAVDKDRVSLATLISALFYDLATEKDFKPPTQSEKRERKLIALIQKHRKLVTLFVDEAHDLHPQTLSKLKRLIELVRLNGGILSVILTGHPKLKNDLRRPTLEEIGARASIFTLQGVQGHQQAYIQWLLRQCTQSKAAANELLTEAAIVLLAERLATPLQIQQYLARAFEESYKAAQKVVTPEIVEMILSKGLDDLEPTLIRHGYNSKVIAHLLNVRPAEVRSFLHGQLPPGRTQDLRDQMLKIGIPV
ncbi:MAG: AAA family ATPase [Cyanothece sp. SIO1E1]|nr:AAA family ATPase [Cyanothece sp. SIO1E1]